MHRHITYYTQSIVCQGGFSNKFLSGNSWTCAGFAKGGQLFFFFGGGGLATRGVAKCLLGGFGGMLPRNFFLNGAIRCVLEHIFINFLLSKSLKIFFFSSFGGLFATFYFMVEAFFWACPPPLRKFLRAPMIARRVREHAPGKFFCVTAI